VTQRSVPEGLAYALDVQPAELVPRDDSPVGRATQLAQVETMLTEWWPGEVPDDRPARPWEQVKAELDTLIQLRERAVYDEEVRLLPGLLHDLLAHAGAGAHRRDALVGLICAYDAAGGVASVFGVRHVSLMCADRIQIAAEQLGDPEWMGAARSLRALKMSSASRSRQQRLGVVAADMPGARLESRGMGHLTAALAAAAQGDGATADEHLTEADRMAGHLDLVQSTWGLSTMHFGRANVGVWRLAIEVELGDERAVDRGRAVQWQALPPFRQGTYWVDLGRALIQKRRTRDEGLRALLKAEEITPQGVRENAFVRDAVTDLMASARRAAGGRELRGLALRMGIAPNR
jgi:hypothetical protein